MKTSFTLFLASIILPVALAGKSLRTSSSRILQSVQEGACQSGWSEQLDLFRYETQVWLQQEQQHALCYNFTFEKLCYCNLQGPIQIAVRNGTVVSPVTNDDGYPYAPTIHDIFNTIYTDCFANCPGQGPSLCNITYSDQRDDGQVRVVQSLYVNPRAGIADDEYYYEITNFAFC